MRKIIVALLVLISFAMAQDMIVRVYAPNWQDIEKISPKYDLDIASARAGEYYDIVADHDVLMQIRGSGLSYEIIVFSIAHIKEQVRADYLSYAEVNDSLQQMVQNYPSICKLDSLPIPTYQGNWMYGVKISDNVHVEEDDEPGFLMVSIIRANGLVFPRYCFSQIPCLAHTVL